MRNNKALNEQCVKTDKELYNMLVSAEEIRVETKWWTKLGERGYPEVEKLDGQVLALDESDAYELVYGDAEVSDFITGFKDAVADSVASFEKHYWDLAGKSGMARNDYPVLDSVQFTVFADGERVMWDSYYL